MAKRKNKGKENNGGANLGFEVKLWATADKLRIKAAERFIENAKP